MIIRIDHTAIAVNDLDKARAFFIDTLGGKELFSAPAEGEGFRWTTIELGSSSFFELLDPIGDDGFVQRFLSSHGEGVHHITMQVRDLKQALDAVTAAGIPTFGHREMPGWKEFFIHPRDAFGALLQFAEFHPLDWINPGYVPKSYQEFVAAQGDREVAVQERDGDGEKHLVLSDGTASLRVPRDKVPELIRRLQEMVGP